MHEAMLTHLACIMDGNRRFAKQQNQLPWWGHQQGAQAVWTVIDFCIERSIAYLSLYLFSLENFKRDQQEQEYLFELLIDQIYACRVQLKEKQIRVKFIGDRSKFPPSVLAACDQLEQETESYARLQINAMFCYGARQEIVSACVRLGQDILQGHVTVAQINEEILDSYLWTTEIPHPDLIIRTGGVRRLSNFLLYQAAYSEFYFCDILWPEIKNQHLDEALEYFKKTKRNFGN